MNDFRKNIINIHGERGTEWLKSLPNIVQKISEHWNLSNLQLLKNLSYNYVLSGLRDNKSIILKLSLDEDNLKKEAAALLAFSGLGTIALLNQQDDALLLEQALPGYSLKQYFPNRENESIDITWRLIKKLHHIPANSSHSFPHISDWFKALDKNYDIPNHHLEKARFLRDQLLSSATKSILLHGDLHHDNIIQNGNSWLAIDPKGVRGELSFEVIAFIINPIPTLLTANNPITIINNRIHLFAKNLNLDPQRIKNYCYVMAVLAWIWTIEDGTDSSYFRNIIEVFYSE